MPVFAPERSFAARARGAGGRDERSAAQRAARQLRIERRVTVMLAAGAVACGGAREDPMTPSSSREEAYALTLEQRCDDGEQERCVELGVRMLDGDSVEHDEIRGVDLLEAACHSGHASGCHALGQAYDAGTGVSADTSRAMELYSRACAMKDHRACLLAGQQHLRGELAPSDPEQASTYLRVACDEGDLLDACVELADLLERGEGVPRDAEAARALRRRACDAGLDGACERPAEDR